MPIGAISTWAGGISLGAWVYVALGRGGFWRLRELPGSAVSAANKRIAVVIPARNEVDVIRAAVRSLAEQEYGGPVRIYVVDDSSTDDTAARARSAASADQLIVLTAPPLAPGWTGKLWALHHGLQAAAKDKPDYLLLTDADIVHGPQSLARLVARAERDHLDLASYMVLLHCRTWAEKALIPAFVFFFFLLYPPAWIANPQRRTAGAAGGCILIRPEALARIGGIAALRNALIDDCKLAQLVKRGGGRLWLGVTRTTRSIREYQTFGEIERMIARTAFTQLQYSTLLLLSTVLGMALVYLAPVWLAFKGSPLGVAALLLMCLLFLPTIRFYRQPWFWAALLPVIALFYLGATIHSACQHWQGKGGQWKGRAQDVAAQQVSSPGGQATTM